MRKPASCVLSIALSVVMSVGLIPSPAFAEIDSTPKPATQSTNKPNENPAETTSDQTQPNDTASNASSETPNQTPECSPSDINATSGASPSNESASDDSATALQSDTDSASNDTPRVDWRKGNRFKWMITADGTLVLRIAELADSNLKYESWKAYPDLIEHADLSQLDTSQAKDLSNLFYGCTSLQSVDLSQLDMSNVTSMRGMFADCKNLKSVNLLGIDTSNVTDMRSMFANCQSLESVDLSQLNTTNVTDMSELFFGCKKLISVDLSALRTTSVTNATRMFFGCESLKNISLSGLDMSSVTDMRSMFYGCKNLGFIDLSALKTARVTNTAWMFSGCEVLNSINLSGLDMSNVTDMNNMFGSCKSLKDINLQGVDTSKVTNMSWMFSGCESLKSIDLSDLDTSSTTNMTFMFDDCKSLDNIDLSKLDTSNVTSMAAMFASCESLSRIDLSNLNAPNVTDMTSMFSGCKALKDVDLSNVDASNVTKMTSMFLNCKSLEHINLAGIKTPKVTDVSAMFSNCASLESIDISPLDTSNVTTISSMFSDCKRLKTISLAGIDTSHVANFANAFKGCSSLATVDLAGIDTTSATDMDSMFAQCTKLQAIDISTFDMSKLGKDPNALSRMFDNCPSLERITVGDKCAVSFPEPGGSRATGNWINTASNEIYAPINVPANVAATYESQLDVTQFPFFYNPDDVTYTGSPIEKKATSTLKQGRDYTVAYANNTKVGTAAITIAGAGRYAGSMELPYDIVKATPSYPEVKGLTATCGQKLSDIALPEGFAWEGDASATVDTPGWPTYTATYTPADTANYSTVSGIEVTIHATQPIDASMFSIEDTDIRYTGNPVMPTVTSSTVPSDQYTVTYENNVAIGQATAIVTATNQNYSGTCKIPFEIKPTNAAANYQHSTTAQSGDIMLTVQWNDPKLGQETTFHVSATGGSGAYQFRMDAPTYMDPDGSSESVADPSRNQWLQYTGECASRDYQFEMTASGTYYLRFYLMDKTAGVYYLRANVFASANDDAYPAVSTIVKSAVDKCNAETDGSDYARTLWLHDWTLDQLEYDHDLNWCSAESGLTRHQGTCESYQRIYAKLLDAAGIANGRITGNGHTWNTVKIDGKWCQMDLTWDDTNDNWYGDLDQRHLYFGLTDELMAIAHSDHTANYQTEGYAYRSTDLTNNYFVRNGKANEWTSAYAERIQQHLDARETEFSIDADNGSFPPSISGIQNALVAYAMNQREWSTGDGSVTLTATSNVTTVSSYQWSAEFDFVVEYPIPADYTVVYHQSVVSDPSSQSTPVTYGRSTPTLKTSELGFSNGSSAFAGWRCYRDMDGAWWATLANGKADWVKADNEGRLPEGCTYRLLPDGWSTGWSASSGTVHFYGTWQKSYTVRYHASTDAEALQESTAVERGTPTPTLTPSELGLGNGSSAFAGWRCYRDMDGAWWATLPDGKRDWVKESGGRLPDGCAYALLPAGYESAWTTSTGTAHFYATWKDSYAVGYRQSAADAPSGVTTQVAYGKSAATETVSSLGFNMDGKAFAGWRCFRDSDQKWWATLPGGKAGWVSMENGALPEGCSFRLLPDGWETGWSTKSGAVELVATWKDAYTISYRLDDSSTAHSTSTKVTVGTETAIPSVSELGYSKPGMSFAGWKCYRDSDGKWWATLPSGKAGWVSLKNGALPEGCSYRLLPNKWKSAWSASTGCVQLYAVWK